MKSHRVLEMTHLFLMLLLLRPILIHSMPPETKDGSASPTAATPTTSSTVFQDVQNTFSGATRSLKQLMQDMAGHSTLAGLGEPVIKKLHLSHEESTLLFQSLAKTVHFEDIVLIAAVGWLSVPAVQFPYQQLPPRVRENLEYLYKYVHLCLDHVQQIAKIALLVYLVDIVKMICIGMGFEICKMDAFPHAFAQSAYILWAHNRVRAWKRHLIHKFISDHPETFGRMQIVNRLADAAVGAATAMVLLNILQVKLGVAMTSFLAFGSAGTLAMGLASQGIAKEVLNGLMLASSDRIYEGDSVRFGNGQAGTIVKLGWMETGAFVALIFFTVWAELLHNDTGHRYHATTTRLFSLARERRYQNEHSQYSVGQPTGQQLVSHSIFSSQTDAPVSVSRSSRLSGCTGGHKRGDSSRLS